MFIDEIVTMNHGDSFYGEPEMIIAHDNYCPECGCENVYQFANDSNSFWCSKCDCQWDEVN